MHVRKRGEESLILTPIVPLIIEMYRTWYVSNRVGKKIQWILRKYTNLCNVCVLRFCCGKDMNDMQALACSLQTSSIIDNFTIVRIRPSPCRHMVAPLALYLPPQADGYFFRVGIIVYRCYGT